MSDDDSWLDDADDVIVGDITFDELLHGWMWSM